MWMRVRVRVRVLFFGGARTKDDEGGIRSQRIPLSLERRSGNELKLGFCPVITVPRRFWERIAWERIKLLISLK
jgi:hypothetical protein